MRLSLEQMLGQRMMLAFQTKGRLSNEIKEALRSYRPGGVTLFRTINIENPSQVRNLTEELQHMATAIGLPPLLIGADQEGGQLMAIGEGVTQLPGNMALGATGSPDLARRAGEVLGCELSAMGINVDYAPCCDVNINPKNPVVGIRSFGEDPLSVGRLAAAMVGGIQSAGVASTAKHFPGHGDTSSDSHVSLPSLPHSFERLQQVELVPFKTSIQAGVKLVMSAHIALPAIDGLPALPATLSEKILKGILRDRLGFDGVIITDAMDMQAMAQGPALGENVIKAAAAGADLLLITSNPADQQVVYSSLLRAATTGKLESQAMEASIDRILALKNWLKERAPAPSISEVGCGKHELVANEIAAKSITLVRDHAGLLPLHLKPGQKLAVVFPKPIDLTPADTSSFVIPGLSAAMRTYHTGVDEFMVSYAPTDRDIADVLTQLRNYNLVVICTLNAFAEASQQTLVREVLRSGIPAVVVALRLPYDLAAFPEASTYVCTYSILDPSMHALASALFGQSPFLGHLPVSIPELYAVRHGLTM